MKKIRYSDFEHVGVTLEGILNSSSFAGKIKKYNLSKIWGQIVGKRFEHRSYPAHLVNKVLKVACENPQITSELVMSKRLVLAKAKSMGETIGLDIEDVMFSHKIWNPAEVN